MLDRDPSKKIVIHVGEDHAYRGKSAFVAILEYLGRKRISQARVTRGIAGFGADHRMHTIAIERLTENLPIQIEFVTSLRKVDELIPELYEMVGTGLIESQDTFVSRPVARAESPDARPALRKTAVRAQLMRIFIGEDDTWGGKPLYEALVESMRANNIAGVTVYRGVQGFGEHRGAGREQIHVASSAHPITISVVENKDKIHALLPFIEEMIQGGGLVALSDVDTIRYTHDFRSAERRTKLR